MLAMMHRVTKLALVLAAAAIQGAQDRPVLKRWERGIALEAREQPGMAMYLWFYEWNMFDAVARGQHTPGSHRFLVTVDRAGSAASIYAGMMRLRLTAVPGGAALTLEVINATDHDWPELAGIIPCWSPGRARDAKLLGPGAFFHEPANPLFADSDRKRTFFLANSTLAPMASREIHFNARLRESIARAAADADFVFSNKWPTSKADAAAGLIVRESSDGKWVTGIAWEDFLSVQAHNPWNCMHACVRVGPLRRGQSKTIRGRLYLLPGGRDACAERFLRDLPRGAVRGRD
jgi:hypothetical protein